MKITNRCLILNFDIQKSISIRIYFHLKIKNQSRLKFFHPEKKKFCFRKVLFFMQFFSNIEKFSSNYEKK